MWSDYRQRIGGSVILAGLIVVVINYLQGDTRQATILLVVLTAALGMLIWWTRGKGGGPHISHAAAQASAGDNDLILYWRPGCIHCDRLKLALGRSNREVSWVNIHRDAEAAEFVAAHRNGNHTVPTAITGSGEMIDATPASINAYLKRTRGER